MAPVVGRRTTHADGVVCMNRVQIRMSFVAIILETALAGVLYLAWHGITEGAHSLS